MITDVALKSNQIDIFTIDDSDVEQQESFQVVLVSNNNEISTATVLVNDNDGKYCCFSRYSAYRFLLITGGMTGKINGKQWPNFSKEFNTSCQHLCLLTKKCNFSTKMPIYQLTLTIHFIISLAKLVRELYTVTACNGYLVSSHVDTVQLPTRCLVDRFLHRPHGSGYLTTCMSDVVTVQILHRL